MSSRPFREIPFGPYLPDLGGNPSQEIPGYLVDALNVRLTQSGYRGMPTFSNIASATALGAMNYARGACFVGESNAHFFVVTDSGAIHESRDEGVSAWEDVSASGTLDPLGDFVRFGNDVVFVGSTRAPIFKDLTDSLATNFASLSGSPPTGACAARVRQHLVIGNLQSDDLFAVQTSAIGDHEDWPTPGSADARSKESIRESLNPEFGRVRRVLGGEKIGIVVQESALTRMTYVGGSVVYTFDAYDQTEGLAGSLYSRPVTDGQFWYFYTDSGLYVTDGYSLKNLSKGKVEEALFLNSISHPNGASLETAISSVYDSRRGSIIFGAGENDGGARYQLVYSVASDSFSLTNETNEMAMFTGNEELGAFLTGSEFRSGIYNVNGADYKLQKLNGATGTIALQTGFIELDPGYRVQLHGAQLIGTDVPGSLSISYKAISDYDDADTLQTGFTAMTAAPRGNKFTARDGGELFAFRVTGTGAESQLIRGIRVYFERAEPAQ